MSGNPSHKVRRQSIFHEEGARLNNFVKKRMFTKGDPSLPHTMTSVPGSSMPFHLKRDKGLMRDSTKASSCQTLPETQQSQFWAYTLSKPDLKETCIPQCSLQHCL